VVAFGLHGALLLGPWHPPTANQEEWEQALSTFTVDLLWEGEVVAQGHASNVLGGPLRALRHLVELLARDPVNPPLAGGEIITTGTLTRVPSVAPGETWTTALTGISLGGIAVRFT
jgi:2-oxo-3-hexenedioate decarboxylase